MVRKYLESIMMAMMILCSLLSPNDLDLFNIVLNDNSHISDNSLMPDEAVMVDDGMDAAVNSENYEADPCLYINNRTAVPIIDKDFVGAPAFQYGTELSFDVSDDISHTISDKCYYYSTTGSEPWTKINVGDIVELKPGNYYISAIYIANGHRIETADYRLFGFTILDNAVDLGTDLTVDSSEPYYPDFFHS